MSIELMLPHFSLLRCSTCDGFLTNKGNLVWCAACDTDFPVQDGYLDLAPAQRMPTTAGLGPLLLQDPLQVARYEDLTRPAFLRVAAANWGPAVTGDEECTYLRDNVDPADGPVLDIACGAGRWTRVFVDAFGANRVIGLDLSIAMLKAIAVALPAVARIRASAMRLPFADNTLGAANCSAALQIMPDPAHVLREVGRCLLPGGTFTRHPHARAATSTALLPAAPGRGVQHQVIRYRRHLRLA